MRIGWGVDSDYTNTFAGIGNAIEDVRNNNVNFD